MEDNLKELPNKFTKFKFMQGQLTHADKKKRFDGIQQTMNSTEGNSIQCNRKWIAHTWKAGGGGAVAVYNNDQFGKLSANIPVIAGHKGPVNDLQFSPMHESMLGTCSQDGTAKMWLIPPEGLQNSVYESDAEMKGHSKKIIVMKWHPTADLTMATASADSTIKIWDVQNEADTMTHKIGEGIPWALDWNFDGSKVAAITKEKKLFMCDPRVEGSIAETAAHQGIKAQRIKFMGQFRPNYAISLGFSDFSDRQFAIWDDRNLSEPVVMSKLDNRQQIAWLHWDDDIQCLYVINKGMAQCDMFYYNEKAGTPEFQYINEFKGNGECHGMGFLPKRDINFMDMEINRALRYGKGFAEWITFKTPRKTGSFAEDIYIPCYKGEMSHSYEEWAGGQNKTPVTLDFRTIKVEKSAAQVKRQSTIALKINKRIVQDANADLSSDDEGSRENLQMQLKKAHEQLIDKEKVIGNLNDQNRQLNEQVKAMQEKIAELTSQRLKTMFTNKDSIATFNESFKNGKSEVEGETTEPPAKIEENKDEEENAEEKVDAEQFGHLEAE